MYQALYRKWRPNVFEDVLGQSHITDTLKNQVENHKLSHAYLFSGSRGTGKTSTAKILSRAVNCLHPVNGNPCNECHACKTALNGSAVDIIEIDAASNNRVDDVRIIRDEVVYTPADLTYKVYIIDEAHMLTNQAFNALLKTLEEPPAHVIFIFATTEPHKFPATILSRCQRFDFKRITPFDTEKRIRQIISCDGYNISEEALGLLARVADGSMRDALSILDQCLSAGLTDIGLSDIAKITGASDPDFIYQFSQNIIDGDLQACFSKVKDAYENGRDMERMVEDLLEHFRSVLVTKTLDSEEAASEILMATKSACRVYAHQAKELSSERLLRYLDTLAEAASSQKYLQNPRLCVEIAVTAMVKRPDLSDVKGLLERLEEVETKLYRLEQTGVKLSQKPVCDVFASTEETKEPASHMETAVSEEPQLTESLIPEEISEVVSDDPIDEVAIATEIPPVLEEGLPQTEVAAESTEPMTTASSDGAVASAWTSILEVGAKHADFGFRRIMEKCTVTEEENTVDLLLESEAFLNIARMNQYDSIVSKAVEELLGKNCRVRLRLKEEKSGGEDVFRGLMNRLNNYQGKITFK
ncbi:MAG: DNA polymerase III subunit gamma/tau [Clostridia bacterium]|nr:DNA polymerase III subunit gamma/tau [Clostridia bacterium]